MDTYNIVEKYILSLKPTSWSEYINLDKYHKVTAFAIEDIEDIDILKAIYKTFLYDGKQFYYNESRRHTTLPLEIKEKIKAIGIKPADINRLEGWYVYLGYKTAHYMQIKDFKLAIYWKISKVYAYDKRADELHNTIGHRSNPKFDIFYPPNFRHDNSDVMALTEKEIQKKYQEYQTFEDIDIEPYKDYDFNIPKYIAENIISKG